MKDQTFHEITLTPREANAALLAHFGMPEGEVRRAISGMTVLRIEVKPPVAAPTAGTADDLPEGEGWVKWAGGECPVPYGTIVDAWFRDGSLLDNALAGSLYWTHRGGPRDIVAYRVRSPAKPLFKFEVGKSYRTRDGRKATITDLSRSVSYPLLGQLVGADASWANNGARLHGKESPLDLVGPWER